MKHKMTPQPRIIISKKLQSYSLFSSAFLLAGLQADTQVIYTDVDPDESYIGDGESYDLDLNNDGTTDFVISIKSATYPGMFYTVYSGATFSGIIKSVYINPGPGNEVAASTFSGAHAYNAYVSVGTDMSFSASSQITLDFFWGVIDYPLPGSVYSYLVLGEWVGVTDKYLGLKIQDGGETYYGWARLDCGLDHDSFTIKDYAYDATPDTPIETGDIAGGNGITFASAGAGLTENGGDFTGEIEIDNSADCSVDVVLNEALTTATNGLDFNFTSPLTLTFTEGGSTVLNFPVDIIDDMEYEVGAVEFIKFDLENITGGCVISSPSEFNLAITDDDTTFVSFGTDLTTFHENDGEISGKLNITWPADCSFSITPTGTATPGIDYTFTDPTIVNFTSGGSTTEEFPILLIDDASAEGDETIVFHLEYAGGAGCIVDPENEDLTFTIIDDENTGIDQKEILNAKVFSFNQSVIIQFDPSVPIPVNFKLFDYTGKLIFEDILNDRDITISMSDLADGIYTVQLISGGKKMEKNIYLGK